MVLGGFRLLDAGDLETRFLRDMRRIGFPVDDVDVEFRPYSKTLYGRYYPEREGRRARVVVYPYERDGSEMDYQKVLVSGIHEFTHHAQYASGTYVRRRGVMHDAEFWSLYRKHMARAQMLGLIESDPREASCGR